MTSIPADWTPDSIVYRGRQGDGDYNDLRKTATIDLPELGSDRHRNATSYAISGFMGMTPVSFDHVATMDRTEARAAASLDEAFLASNVLSYSQPAANIPNQVAAHRIFFTGPDGSQRVAHISNGADDALGGFRDAVTSYLATVFPKPYGG